MVPDFTFEVKPVVVRKEHAKRNDFANHHLAHGIEITAAFGKIGNTRGMAFFTAVPNRVEVYAQPGSRSSFIHGLKPY
jgi:hypothetical protein